jgi:adenylate cyclase
MATRARTARRPALLIALGIIALIGALWYVAPNFLHTIEFNLYDQHFRLRGPRPPNPQVAIVTIDEVSLGVEGRWPWSRRRSPGSSGAWTRPEPPRSRSMCS